jgi:hypothetical protein
MSTSVAREEISIDGDEQKQPKQTNEAKKKFD